MFCFVLKSASPAQAQAQALAQAQAQSQAQAQAGTELAKHRLNVVFSLPPEFHCQLCTVECHFKASVEYICEGQLESKQGKK